MKCCTKCNQEKSEDRFSRDRSKKDGLRTTCKDCNKNYYNENKDKLNAYSREYQKEHRERLREYNKEKCRKLRKQYRIKWQEIIKRNIDLRCQMCGYDKYFAVLEFHHRNPNEKENMISNMMDRKPTKERIILFEEEIKKCDLLCANCHREIHVEERI